MVKSGKQFIPGIHYLIFFGWILYAGFNLFHHEVWRDEVHSWAIAKSADSIGEIFERTKFEGHPSLWYLLLYGLKQFSVEITALKLFHFAFAAGAMWLLIFRSRFTLLQKSLLVFGYFFVYEYVVFARNYSTAILSLFAFCVFYEHRKLPWGMIGCCISIVLMAFCNLYSYVISLALGALLTWETLRHFGLRNRYVWSVFVVWLMSSTVAALDIRPAEGCIHAQEWKTSFDRDAALFATSTFWNAYAPVPHVQERFWNTNILDNRYGYLKLGEIKLPYSWNTSNQLKTLFGLIVIVLMAIYLRRQPRILLFFLVVNAIYLVLQYTKFQGHLRHHGHFWIVLLVSAWLAQSDKKVVLGRNVLFQVWFSILLLLHVIAGVIASWHERTFPFSPNEAAAKYLTAQPGFKNSQWICDNDWVAEGVSGILGKDILLNSGANRRWGTYVVWDDQRSFCDHECLLKIGAELSTQKGNDSWFLMQQPIQDSLLTQTPGLHHEIDFPSGIEGAESFFIYRLTIPEK